MFFAHDVETARDGRVDADGEVVVNDVARYRVALLVPADAVAVRGGGGVLVVGDVSGGRRLPAAAAAVVDHRRRGQRRGGRGGQRRSAELDVPAVHHDDRAASDAVDDLAQLFTLVTCQSRSQPHTPSAIDRESGFYEF